MKDNVPPAYGYVEGLEEAGGQLVASGWMLLKDGPFDGFRATCSQPTLDLAVERVARPDLQQAVSVPGAEGGGFRVRVPVGALAPEQTIEIEVLGLRQGRPAGRMLIGYHRTSGKQAFPPGAVMKRATRNDGQSFWRATGIKAVNDFRRALAGHLDLQSIRRLLEWGCSSGRVTVHLIDRFPQAEVHGTDIDKEAVEWAASHLRGTFVPCSTDPPLPYPEATFDLIVALSVFTHLTKPYQDMWLTEMRRCLRPGAVLLATTQGEFAARWSFTNTQDCERVMKSGFSDETRDDGLGHVAGTEYYRSTYQSRAFTEREWGKWFEVIDYVEGGMNNYQDIWILRKP
ncbi:MAG TPA: class I SAM-dependent methyltransferase [Planctomycetota bacterium]|nr:class I SAM-dependent methyltransferase [Planctomycetota bacterium]